MRALIKKIPLSVLMISMVLSSAVFAQTKQNIDLLLHNGKVFSADENGTMYEAVAVDGEKIVAVGSSKDLQAKYNAKRSIDLKGKLVTPGFNDAHIHFVGVGLALLRVDLVGSLTLDEAKRRIAAKIKELPKGAWVLGRGWDHTLWNNRLPTRQDLDDIAPDNPVYLQRVDGHIAWANSLALKLANVTKDTKAPEGGELVFDDKGELSGVLKETAQGLVGRIVPEPTAEEVAKGIELALEQAKRYGLTSVQGGADYEAIPLYRKLLDEDKLTARVAVWQNFELPVETLKRQRDDFQALKINPSHLKLGILKGFVDGTLGSRTAAMLAPFSDDPGNSGIPRRAADEMIKMIVERDAAGFQIGLHAIGDRANRIALDGFEKGRKESTFRTDGGGPENEFYVEKRHRIEHAQVVAPSDFKRFAELGVIASMQPSHAISDKRWAGERLGEYRVLGAYSWHTFMANNVHVAFGTDAPVESLDTYQTLYAAVSRQDISGDPANGWQPQEKLSMKDAIRSYTYESAYAEFAEKEKGEIKVGMLADLVVHSKDLLTIPHKEILTTEPVYTIFNGKVIYQKY
ncbi:MAG: amidohydrolase [Pyrinomonadaceae bacterium]|nr:amidohydrolase [Pyrinomonadaceae bacterium]